LAIFKVTVARAADNTYEFNVNPVSPIAGNWSAFGNFGYYEQPNNFSRYRFGWPDFIYRAKDWMQLVGGLDAYYTDNLQSADTLELRPYAGVRLFVPNQQHIILYNFTRFEYLDTQNQDTDAWSGFARIRSRFGVEIPLTTRLAAWEPKTFYVLTDVEPFYRFDREQWSPVQVRGGLGYIVNDRIRVELIYTARFTSSANSSSLDYTDNIIELNIRIGLAKGLLGRLLNPD
jgi:hypothetical protein